MTEQAKLTDDEVLQNKIELSIQEFINKQKSENNDATPLFLAAYCLFGEEPHMWEDQIHYMREHIKVITEIFLNNPEVLMLFAEKNKHNTKIGDTLTNITRFLYLVDNPLAKAEIDLASLEAGLVETKTLHQFPMPYKR